MQASERLKGIDVFVAVVDAGSFAAASERLHLTASAVGKAIGRLESRLEVRLFERTTRRLALTEAGRAFHRTCQRVLEDLEDAEHALGAEARLAVGPLRIDLPATYGRIRVLPLLLDFMRAHPGVQPRISLTDRFVDLVEDNIDVAVRIGGTDRWPAAIAHRALGRERRVLCCTPAYRDRVGGPADDPSTLGRLDAVLYLQADGVATPWRVRRDGGLVEPWLPPARLEVGSAEAVVDAVVQGIGAAQLPTWLIQHRLDAGDLVDLAPSLAVDGSPLTLLWRRSRERLPKVDALLQCLAGGLQV